MGFGFVNGYCDSDSDFDSDFDIDFDIDFELGNLGFDFESFDSGSVGYFCCC